MLNHNDIEAKVLAVREALHDKLGVKRRSLALAVRRAGRRLPRRIRRQGAVLVQAERMGGNPKMIRRVDAGAFGRAYDDVMAHLARIDAADARKGRLLSLAGAIAFNLLLIIAAFVTWLWWRGYV